MLDPKSIPVRFSNLKKFDSSAAHYRHAIESPFEGNEATRLGSAVHSVLTGKGSYVVFPGKVRRGKEWDAFRADNEGALILSQSEADDVTPLVESFRRNRHAMEAIANPIAVEETIHWSYKGRAFSSTPDIVTATAIVDIKTTRSADLRWFARDVREMNYHAQVECYNTAWEFKTGERKRDHIIIAIDKEAPHCCEVFRLSPGMVADGAARWRGWFDRLLECEALDYWPGYADGIVDLMLEGEAA